MATTRYFTSRHLTGRRESSKAPHATYRIPGETQTRWLLLGLTISHPVLQATAGNRG